MLRSGQIVYQNQALNVISFVDLVLNVDLVLKIDMFSKAFILVLLSLPVNTRLLNVIRALAAGE